MRTGLEGKGVLVTGASGRIGSALVHAFVAEGARVGIHYRTNSEGAAALAEDTQAVALKADLAVEDQADALIPAALDALSRLDVLIANAGKWPPQDVPLWEMDLDRWNRTIDDNLTSVFLSCRAFLRHVASTGHGCIVLISSTAGIFGEAGHADYAAAKGALASGLVKSLKNEIVRIAPAGRVNSICPGWTRGQMDEGALQDPELVPRVTRTMPLKKLGKPEDVARIAVTLASDEISGHVTGEVITVAGGMEGRVL